MDTISIGYISRTRSSILIKRIEFERKCYKIANTTAGTFPRAQSITEMLTFKLE